MQLLWEDRAWSDYLYWQGQDKKTLKKLNELIKEIQRNPNGSLGKAEALKYSLTGLYSRRINSKDRLVYFIKDDIIHIVACRGHYE